MLPPWLVLTLSQSSTMKLPLVEALSLSLSRVYHRPYFNLDDCSNFCDRYQAHHSVYQLGWPTFHHVRWSRVQLPRLWRIHLGSSRKFGSPSETSYLQPWCHLQFCSKIFFFSNFTHKSSFVYLTRLLLVKERLPFPSTLRTEYHLPMWTENQLPPSLAHLLSTQFPEVPTTNTSLPSHQPLLRSVPTPPDLTSLWLLIATVLTPSILFTVDCVANGMPTCPYPTEPSSLTRSTRNSSTSLESHVILFCSILLLHKVWQLLQGECPVPSIPTSTMMTTHPMRLTTQLTSSLTTTRPLRTLLWLRKWIRCALSWKPRVPWLRLAACTWTMLLSTRPASLMWLLPETVLKDRLVLSLMPLYVNMLPPTAPPIPPSFVCSVQIARFAKSND